MTSNGPCFSGKSAQKFPSKPIAVSSGKTRNKKFHIRASPKPPLTKPPFPIFRFFCFFLALTVRAFRIFRLFGCILLCFPVLCSMPGVDQHVPHLLWIESEEYWDDQLCQGWVLVHTKRRTAEIQSVPPKLPTRLVLSQHFIR